METSALRNARRVWGAAIVLVALGMPCAAAAEGAGAAGMRSLAQESARVTGRVIDGTTARPLPGVHVQVAGSGNGTLTDAAGAFVLAGLAPGEVEVTARLLGYGDATRRVTVAADGGAQVEIALSPAALSLDGVVVTGTPGQARRREVGNSIAQLDLAGIDEPVANVDQLLQGRTSSITVTSTGASFGAGAAIRLRGNVSLTMSNQPLIFVDGVRQAAESYPLNASSASFPHYGSGSTMSPLNDIRPSDIERIEIVKGAAATTLYGSEASAGVIQIFTKKGDPGRPRWTFQTDHGLDWVQPFGSEQRPYVGLDPWLKTAYSTRNTLSVRGGGDAIRYFASGAYDTGEGVLPDDGETRAAVRVNLDLQPLADLGIQINSSFTEHSLTTTQSGNTGMGIPLNAFRAPNNSFGSADPAVISQLLDSDAAQENTHLTLGVTANWAPYERLTQRVTLGLDRIANRATQYRPFGFVLDPEGVISDIRWSSRTLTADYAGSLGWLTSEILAGTFSWGAQTITTDEATVDSYGRGFPGPGKHTLSSTAERFVYGTESRYVSGGFFLQNLFGFRDRVFLTLGARADGTSTFGENLGLQVYPKASLSWVLSEEPFWGAGWGEVKLRAAYGLAGRAPGAFDAVRTWNPGSFGGESSFLPGNVGNPDLGPEKTREIEAGFDASWFEGRLSAEVTYYDQVTRDALFNVAQIPTRGFTGSQLENVGRITNRGLEVGLNGDVYRSRELTWSLGGTLSTNRSEVLDAGSTTSSTIVVGQPAPVVRGTRVVNADEYADPVYELDHFFGPNQPTLTLGVHTDLELPRGFRLSARGEFQGGHYISDSASNFMIDRGAGAPGCDGAYQLVPFDAFAGADLSGLTALQRARCYRETFRSGLWIYPADFFKLRELTLLAPLDALVPGGANATLTLSLRNAYRWTNADFWAFDPEMISSRSTTNALTSGITEHAPAPARFAASVRVAF